MSLSVNQKQNNNYQYDYKNRSVSDVKKSPIINESDKFIPKTCKHDDNSRFIFGASVPVWFDKAMTKLSYLISGKSDNSVSQTQNDTTSQNIPQTIKPQAPNKEFEKLFYSNKTNYIDMYIESQRLEKERLELLSSNNKVKQRIYFEDTQDGYIPSTKGFIEEKNDKDITSYIPSSKGVKPLPDDLTAAKRAIKKSIEAENLTNSRMKDRFRHKFV